jgi:hypothetical protein
MAKQTPKFKAQKRDWIIFALVIAIVATNWVWYENSKSQDITNKNNSSAWLMHQVEINKLQACINASTHPCDIQPPKY